MSIYQRMNELRQQNRISEKPHDDKKRFDWGKYIVWSFLLYVMACVFTVWLLWR